MKRIKYLIIASLAALIILLMITYLINSNENSEYINVAMVSEDINEGEELSHSNIKWIKISLPKSNLDNKYITESNISNYNGYILNKSLVQDELVLKEFLVNKEEYLDKTEGLEYIALPIKSSTEGVCYKIKKGDMISVYYTAKRKLVDSVLNDKKKIYSVATSDTLVTCLLYENIEIMATTDNLGKDAEGTSITDIVVRLTQEQILELANLKEQGIFTISLK